MIESPELTAYRFQTSGGSTVLVLWSPTGTAAVIEGLKHARRPDRPDGR